MMPLTRYSQTRTQIHWADEENIYSLHHCNFIHAIKGGRGLNLYDCQKLRICRAKVFLKAQTKTAGAVHGGHASYPSGGIAHGRYRHSCFFWRLHVRDHNSRWTEVENAFESDRIVPCYPYDWRCRSALNGLQLNEQFVAVSGAMLKINQEPVESRLTGNFRGNA